MILLLTAVLFGLGFAYLATQNTTGVSLQAGPFLFANIPLYIVVLSSLLFGLFISWILSSVGWVTSALAMHGKDKRIKEVEEQRDELRRQLQQLALENNRLADEKEHVIRNEEVHDAHEEQYEAKPRRSFLDRFRHPHSPAL